MTGKVTDHETMLAVQGDRVMVHWRYADGSEEGDMVLTFVHVVDVAGHELRLINRDEKSHEPDWAVGQKLFESIQPASTNKLSAKWKMKVKL